MTAAYFEEHPTDPDKVIMRKPPHDIDLFWRVSTAPEKWVGLTDKDYFALQMKIKKPMTTVQDYIDAMRMVEQALKEKNT